MYLWNTEWKIIKCPGQGVFESRNKSMPFALQKYDYSNEKGKYL